MNDQPWLCIRVNEYQNSAISRPSVSASYTMFPMHLTHFSYGERTTNILCGYLCKSPFTPLKRNSTDFD
jgi:hypothetical protein